MRRFSLALIFLAILVVFSATANAQKERLLGDFVPIDNHGITRVTLTADDQIHVWGICHPSDCDWGIVPVDTYGPTVSSNLGATANSLSAVYLHGFATRIVVVTPLEENKIQIDVFTKFTDHSGRTPYMLKQILVRRENMALKP